jgi:hypothetical protein
MDHDHSAPQDLDAAISQANDAVDDGRHQDAARLWSCARRFAPADLSLLIGEVTALLKAADISGADAVAHAAMEENNTSPSFALEWCRAAYKRFDWEEALIRHRIVRGFFPNDLVFLADSFREEAHCLLEMADFPAGQRVLDDAWPTIMAASHFQAWNLFDVLHNLGDQGKEIEAVDKVAAFSANDSVVDGEFLASVSERARRAQENIRWLAATSPDVRVISVGQNCLPFQLPVRWGLAPRPEHNTLMPFDLGAHIANTAADIIDADFADYVDDDVLDLRLDAQGFKFAFQKKFHIGFFHERGSSWLGQGIGRLQESYRRRIENFRRLSAQPPTVFFFCLCGAGSIDMIVDALKDHLAHPNVSMLVVNVMQEAVAPPPAHDRILYRHIPYPRDYSWSWVKDINSQRGLAFEGSVADALKDAIRKTNAYHL